jgi:hypothetical protein
MGAGGPGVKRKWREAPLIHMYSWQNETNLPVTFCDDARAYTRINTSVRGHLHPRSDDSSGVRLTT